MPPSVNANATEKTLDVQAGNVAYLFYDATDVGGSIVKQADFQFTNSANQSIYLQDRDNDGVATVRLNDTQTNGTYTLNEVSIRDGRAQENRVSMNESAMNLYGGDNSHTGNVPHNFTFADYTIEVTAPTGGSISDSVDPTLSAVTVVTDTVNVGEIASVNYVGDGTGSDLTQVQLYFRNEAAGTQFNVNDYDGDGTATAHLNQNQLAAGTYEFLHGSAVDQANNRLHLNAEAFDASITLVMPTNLNEAQTDFEPPILDDLSFLPDIA